MVDLNTIRSIKNKDFIPIPNATAHNADGTCWRNGIEIAGTWDFFSIDDYETYQKSLKIESENWYYRSNPVRYTLNSHGYRTKEFKDIDWENSVVIFGCSRIFGTGVDDSHTIPTYLEKLLGIPVINMGMSGTSIQFALHNSLMLYQKYGPPKAVLYGMTGIGRYLYYQRSHVNNSCKYEDKVVEDAIDHLIPFNLVNVELIRNLWKDKCKYYEFSLFPTTSKILGCDLYSPILGDYARDKSHSGRKSNELIAQSLYKKLQL